MCEHNGEHMYNQHNQACGDLNHCKSMDRERSIFKYNIIIKGAGNEEGHTVTMLEGI